MQQRSHIGVTTETAVQSAPSNQSVPSGLFQLAAITVKGPLNYSGIVRNLDQYTRLFGGRAPYETGYETARTYFQEGGAELAVTRVIGPAATNGAVTLTDGAATPVSIATIEVIDPGAHTADYQAVVTHNTDNTFNVTVLDTTTSRVVATFQRAESAADLASLALGNENVNVSAVSATGRPEAGTFNFTAGTDDRAAITADTYGTALANHKGVRPGVVVACPGQHPLIIAAVLGEHAATHSKIGLLDIPAGSTIDEAKSIGEQLLGSTYASYLSMPLYPAIRVPDGNDRTRITSPIGYAAAKRSLVHRSSSFAAAVAGPRVASVWNFTPSVRCDEEDVNELNRSGINAIQSGTGAPFLNNWSSLSTEPGLFDLNVRDTMNNLTVLFSQAFQELIWRPNDGRDNLRAEAQAIVDGIMEPLVRGSFLFPSQDADGNLRDNGYSVEVEDIATSGQAAPYDRVQIAVGVKLSPTIRHIHVPIRNVDLRSAL